MQKFSYITWTYVPKNKLEEAVLEFLKTKIRKVITREKVIDFYKENILMVIEELNKKHKRCKPIKAYWEVDNKMGDENLRGVNVCVFKLYAINE